MSTLQAVIASISIPYGPPPPGPVGTLTWDTTPESYTRPSGGTDPVLTSLLMPDNSTTQDVHVFSGTDYIVTPGHNIAGVYFNIWFYPTSNNVELMTHQGSEFEQTSYYYNMLEINASGGINAGGWNGGSITSVTSSETVNLNAWNHVYYRCSGGTLSVCLNNGSTYSTLISYSAPTTSYFAIGATAVTYMTSNARFQGTLGDVAGSSYIAGSNYNDTKAVYGLT